MVEPPVVLLPYNHALIKYFEICISPVTSGLIIAEWSLLKKKIQSYKVDVSVIPSKDYCRDLCFLWRNGQGRDIDGGDKGEESLRLRLFLSKVLKISKYTFSIFYRFVYHNQPQATLKNVWTCQFEEEGLRETTKETWLLRGRAITRDGIYIYRIYILARKDSERERKKERGK